MPWDKNLGTLPVGEAQICKGKAGSDGRSGNGEGMDEAKSRTLSANGIRLHVVEQGTGPLVLFVHGFPETSYSWRRQLPAIAAAGYRAAAVDVRGYGRSSKPRDVAAYRMMEHVADNVAVVDALGERTAIIIGHDWGSPIAANSALLEPQVFHALGMLSVPYTPRGRTRPSELHAALSEDAEFYLSYFQQPGRAEAEIEPDIRSWLKGFYAGLSADTAPSGGASSVLYVTGERMCDNFPDGQLPGWLTQADLELYAGEFERTGMSGALNRYRNADRDWVDLAAWEGAPIGQPAIFIGGAQDGSTQRHADAIARFATTLPGLLSSHVLDMCGHWVQQERPSEVNELLIAWLHALGR